MYSSRAWANTRTNHLAGMWLKTRPVLLVVVFATTLTGWFLFAGVIPALAAPLDHTQNILILGSDQRPGDTTWRTDTLMIAAVDWDENQLGLLSIPRDLYVDIPSAGKGRVNTADEMGVQYNYPCGGAALVSAVLSNSLGIRTGNYVRIKMPALVQAIDAMGGITITLEAPFSDRAPDEASPTHWTEIALSAGPNHLDGAAALRYARARLGTNDFDRTRRQQQVILAMRQRFIELDWISRLPELWGSWQNLFETDLSWWDILRLAWFATHLESNQVHGRVFGYGILTPYVTERGAMFSS